MRLIKKPCEELHLAAALGNRPCSACGESSWVDESMASVHVEERPYVDSIQERTIDPLRMALADARMEIDVLRQYGNKDCTAMADEELERLRGDAHYMPPVEPPVDAIRTVYMLAKASDQYLSFKTTKEQDDAINTVRSWLVSKIEVDGE